MKKLTIFTISGGVLIVAAIVAMRNCDGTTTPSADGRTTPKNNRDLPAIGSASSTIAASMVGKLKFKEMKQEFPRGNWLGISHPAEPSANILERFDPYPEEQIQLWAKPDLYWGEKGELVHAAFRRGLYETVNLDGKGEESLRDTSGLAIVRSGIPADVKDIEKLNAAIFSAGVEWWVRGGENEDREIEFTPVMVEVLFAKETGAATKDHGLVGQQIPMVLVKVGYPYYGDNPVRTGTDLDDVPEGGRIRRYWYLLPYSPSGEAPPEVVGAALFDEPLLKVWKEQKAKKGESGDGSK